MKAADTFLKLDLDKTKTRYIDIRKLLQKTEIELGTSDTNLLYGALKELLRMSDENESELIEKLELCVSNDTKEEVALPQEPFQLLQKLSTSRPSWVGEYKNHIQQFNELMDGPEYDEWRDRLDRCLKEKERHAEVMKNATNTILMLFGKYNNVASNCTEGFVIANEFEKQWQMMPERFTNSIGPLNDSCVYAELGNDHLKAIDDLPITQEYEKLPLIVPWGTIAEGFLVPFVIRQPSIKDKLLTPYRLYLENEKATKLQLYRVTSSSSYGYLVVSFQQLVMEMTNAIGDAKGELTEYTNTLSTAFKLLYDLPIPVMTDKAVKTNLVSLQLFKDEFQDDPLIRNLTEQVLDLGLNGSTAFSHLMEAVTDYYVSRFTTAEQEIGIIKDKLLREMAQIANDLLSFANPLSQITKP